MAVQRRRRRKGSNKNDLRRARPLDEDGPFETEDQMRERYLSEFYNMGNELNVLSWSVHNAVMKGVLDDEAIEEMTRIYKDMAQCFEELEKSNPLTVDLDILVGIVDTFKMSLEKAQRVLKEKAQGLKRLSSSLKHEPETEEG